MSHTKGAYYLYEMQWAVQYARIS